MCRPQGEGDHTAPRHRSRRFGCWVLTRGLPDGVSKRRLRWSRAGTRPAWQLPSPRRVSTEMPGEQGGGLRPHAQDRRLDHGLPRGPTGTSPALGDALSVQASLLVGCAQPGQPQETDPGRGPHCWAGDHSLHRGTFRNGGLAWLRAQHPGGRPPQVTALISGHTPTPGHTPECVSSLCPFQVKPTGPPARRPIPQKQARPWKIPGTPACPCPHPPLPPTNQLLHFKSFSRRVRRPDPPAEC